MKLADLMAKSPSFQQLGSSAKEAVQSATVKPPTDALRPQVLDEFIGQDSVRAQLRVMIAAALKRGKPLEHLLMTGPGGLGKTTLALMMANEMSSEIVTTTAPTLGQEPLTRMLCGLRSGTILFIDEIHRMSKRTEELLYAAMEDGFIDCNTPMGFERRKVQPFTLVGATTLPGMMSESFKDRFGYVARLEYYSVRELIEVSVRSASVLHVDITPTAAEEIAVRSRGVPRVANSLLRRLRDYAEVHSDGTISDGVARDALALYGVDECGLDSLDRSCLVALVSRFNSGPIGLSNLAVAVGECENTIEKDVEPYLVRLGLIARTPRGRVATENGRLYAQEIMEEN